MGVFHLPKDSGKFRKLWWEMFIGEGRVPFDTLVPFIPRLPSPSDVFPAKYKMVAQLLLLNEMLDFSLEEESLVNSDDDDITILAAVATYMRRDLHRNKGFYENILPAYAIDEFKSHFRMTRGTFEALYREVQATGRVPKFLNQEPGHDRQHS